MVFFFAILIGFIVLNILLDLYAIFYLKWQLFSGENKSSSIALKQIFQIYLFLNLLWYLFFLIYLYVVGQPGLDYAVLRHYFTMFGMLMLFGIPKFLYQFLWLIERLYIKIVHRRLLSNVVLILPILLFLGMAYGMLWGKVDYMVHKETLRFKNLPPEFDGFRILQISDLHLGSYYGKEQLFKAIELIKEQHADAIMFTGDMVNVIAYEAMDYIDLLSSIKAPYGKFSVLGNHDMNDYRKIDAARAGINSINDLIVLNKVMGFDLLQNENRIIVKGKDSIAIIGVKNWGKPPFKAYGKLSKAIQGIERIKFKVLLSHDPSHWKAQVLPQTDIDLTLSGHTHGFQAGINTKWVKWGLGSGKYHEWLGLYKSDGRYLYVNAGLGFVGIPCRLGIRPEITIIELRIEN